MLSTTSKPHQSFCKQPVTVEIEHYNIGWAHDNDDINRALTFGKADTLSGSSPPQCHAFISIITMWPWVGMSYIIYSLCGLR